jgi:asparagine synthase (glutamine-hydrolysing)
MANFIILIDADAERRRRFAEKVLPMLSPMSGLSTGSIELGDFFAGWAAAPSAPVTCVRRDSSAAVVWGEPIDDSSARLTAADMIGLWQPATRARSFFNGYYAAAVFDTNSGLAVGADLLGLYPVYYWSRGDVMLAGSSPELFRLFPLFEPRIDPQGLMSILLTMHISGGATILRDVSRLGPGCMLVWDGQSGARELIQYRVDVSRGMFDLPFTAHVEGLDEAIGSAIKRAAPSTGKYRLMLSGGLDSRMIGGYLRNQSADVTALTMGIPSDIEMQVARKVARQLGSEHDSIEVGYHEYAECARKQARWESMSNGFNDILNWGVSIRQAASERKLIMGHVLDAVVGTRSIGWAYEPCGRKLTFDSLFRYVNGWGLSRVILDSMFEGKAFEGMAEGIIASLRQEYLSYSDSASQQAWCFNLYNRQRYHVGGAAWALSFNSWPVLPALDRRLLECAGSIPAASIGERRAQCELLCRKFRDLAALPLDRNSHDTTPLQPRLRYQLKDAIRKRLSPFNRQSRGKGSCENRYYYRVYDIDNPGWSSVRLQAEPFRGNLHNIFQKKVLDEILPLPGRRAQLSDRIIGASGLKALIGVMIWSQDHTLKV